MHEKSPKHNVEVTILDGAIRVALRFPEVFVDVRKPSHADLLRAVHQQADRFVVAMRTETEVAGVSDGGAPAPSTAATARTPTSINQDSRGYERKRRDGLPSCSKSQSQQRQYSHCNACLRRRRRQADVENRGIHGGAYGQHLSVKPVECQHQSALRKSWCLKAIKTAIARGNPLPGAAKGGPTQIVTQTTTKVAVPIAFVPLGGTPHVSRSSSSANSATVITNSQRLDRR